MIGKQYSITVYEEGDVHKMRYMRTDILTKNDRIVVNHLSRNLPTWTIHGPDDILLIGSLSLLWPGCAVVNVTVSECVKNHIRPLVALVRPLLINAMELVKAGVVVAYVPDMPKYTKWAKLFGFIDSGGVREATPQGVNVRMMTYTIGG